MRKRSAAQHRATFMMKLEFKPFYERNLPHFQKNDVYYFITMRLSGSLPLEVILELQKEQRERLKLINSIVDILENLINFLITQNRVQLG
jgi:hypothetical protein